MKRSFVAMVAAVMVLAAPAAFGKAGGGSGSSLRPASGPRVPSMSTRIAGARHFGYVKSSAYLRQKAAIDAAARAHDRSASPAAPVSRVAPAPTIQQSFEGPHDALVAPSDAQGAVGPTRFVNLVNEQYSIYNRTTPVPVLLSSGPLSSFTNVSADQFGLFDVQVIWDPGTQRFYYVMDDVVCGSLVCTDHEDFKLAWGFSKFDSPNTPQDWCHYQTDFNGVYGTNGNFPDYPKLGDTKDFILVGINTYPHLTSFLSSDVGWISKPPAGATCPASDSFKQGVQQDVKTATGATAFTPVPVNQVDDSSTGYVVANDDLGDPGDPGSAPAVDVGTSLTLLTVTKNLDGTANITPSGKAIKVPSYTMPPSAPQQGTTDTLDTLDGRLTQAMSSSKTGSTKTLIYTQHTIAGGAGSIVRWYKINPLSLKRKARTISDPALYVFNGSVSTDRAVTPTGAAFGSSILLGFDTSSASTLEAIQTQSFVPHQGLSAFVLVKQSDHADNDFTCTPCRWGDYAAAGPDPAAPPTGAHGSVWFTSMWSTNGDPIFGSNYWRSWNWAATP